MSPNSLPGEAALASQDRRKHQVRAEQIRLLYTNANLGIGVTVVASVVLGYLQWAVIPHPTVLGWLVYMLAVSSARFTLGRFYWHASPATTVGAWGTAFAAGAGLSAAGWGTAGILLNPEAELANQVFLAFVLGGMMLGAASLLAPRPEAFLAFIVPTGLAPAITFLLQGGEVHRAMGLLGGIFTTVTLLTTWRIYRTVASSLTLRFENQDLVADLQAAKDQAEALNQRLELRVQERTAELLQSNERLRAEIQQRMQVEDELLRARKLESLGVLAGGIAHDFNNFLTVVQGNIGLAKMELERGNSVYDILEQIAGACQRGAALASQLLTFGKGSEPVRRTASITRLVKDNVDLARAGANVSIDLDLAEDLWPADIDVSQISHALQNILLNALQAMPEGGIIEVRAANVVAEPERLPVSAGKYVRISVRDYGCGIPPEVLPRVFDPYFTTKKGGTGLGLAAAHAIVAKHRGAITAQSTVGLETTFSIYLPASDQPVPAELSAREAVHTGSARILVMDDEEPIRKLLARVLERMGYEVKCAADGAEAIILYEQAKGSGHGFDAVLLDLTVAGGMGGKEAAARLREIDPPVKLIVSSGYSEAPVMADFRRYGFDDAISKPWTPAQVSAVFQRILETSPERKKP
jgi:signal transduction histidine kinase/CheY-like chemotaxis protein